MKPEAVLICHNNRCPPETLTHSPRTTTSTHLILEKSTLRETPNMMNEALTNSYSYNAVEFQPFCKRHLKEQCPFYCLDFFSSMPQWFAAL